MVPSKAKVVTISALAMGIVVLIITALYCERGLSAKKLKDMGALHSVPELFQAYARELEKNGIPSPASLADRFPYRIVGRLHFLRAYPSVRDVFPEFQDRDLESAAAISEALFGILRSERENSLPEFVDQMKSENAYIRRLAAVLVCECPDLDNAREIIKQMLRHKDPSLRYYAVTALDRMGSEARFALPNLIEALKDEESFVRIYAAVTVGQIGPEAGPAVPALIQMIESSNAKTDPAYLAAVSAADALGEIGSEARAAEPQLKLLLKHENEQVRKAAAEALKKIQGKQHETQR